MPRSVVRSARWPASCCMRWSGLTPTAPALASRKARAGPQPLVDQVERQALAQLEPDHLVEPLLGDIEHEQAAGDGRKDRQLVQEFGKVTPRQRVKERLVPAIEQDLPDGGGDDDGEDRDAEPDQHGSHRRALPAPAAPSSGARQTRRRRNRPPAVRDCSACTIGLASMRSSGRMTARPVTRAVCRRSESAHVPCRKSIPAFRVIAAPPLCPQCERGPARASAISLSARTRAPISAGCGNAPASR